MTVYKFQLKKITFDADAWRKLSGLEIEIAKRITLIVGHNGIGKSTILGLIANSAEASEEIEVKPYGASSFRSDFQDLFRLTVEDLKKGRANLFFEAQALDSEDSTCYELIKGCNVSRREGGQLRVVPRTVIKKGTKLVLDQKNSICGVGPDQKVKMPTLYVGMSRAWPLGEAANVEYESYKDIHLDDLAFIFESTKSIIPYIADEKEEASLLTVQGLGSINRKSVLPNYSFNPMAISLGQGALARILNAIVSFRKLKRELQDTYPGGILVIDEVDAGLHPRAQKKLMELLKKEARELELQVIVTSHSMPIIEVVDGWIQGAKEKGNPQDSMVTLVDTYQPKVRMWGLAEIRRELYLEDFEERLQNILVLTEDDEALDMLKAIKDVYRKIFNRSRYGQDVEIAALNLGSGQLQKLASHKNLTRFKNESIFVLDGDAQGKVQRSNMVCLPTTGGQSVNPEREIANYLKLIQEGKFPETSDILLDKVKVSSNWIQEHWLEEYEKIDQRAAKSRESLKNWYKKIPNVERKTVWRCWVKDHPDECKAFCELLETAFRSITVSE